MCYSEFGASSNGINMEMRFIVIVLVIIYMGCNPDNKETEILLSESNPDSLTRYNEIKLTKDIHFGDTDDLFFTSMGEFAVDDSGRVYIADEAGDLELYMYLIKMVDI